MNVDEFKIIFRSETLDSKKYKNVNWVLPNATIVPCIDNVTPTKCGDEFKSTASSLSFGFHLQLLRHSGGSRGTQRFQFHPEIRVCLNSRRRRLKILFCSAEMAWIFLSMTNFKRPSARLWLFASTDSDLSISVCPLEKNPAILLPTSRR